MKIVKGTFFAVALIEKLLLKIISNFLIDEFLLIEGRIF